MSGLTNDDELIIKFNNYRYEKLKEIKDPNIKNEILGPYESQNFYKKVIKDNNLDIVGIEKNNELLHRVNKFINFLKKTKCKKMIVVSHNAFLEILLNLSNFGILTPLVPSLKFKSGIYVGVGDKLRALSLK